MFEETPEQQEERIYRYLCEVKSRIEQDLDETTDVVLKRIEVDAATTVTLSLVSELLPEHIQEHVKAIIQLHEQVWNMDTPAPTGATPRKPLGERLTQRFSYYLHSVEERKGQVGYTHMTQHNL